MIKVAFIGGGYNSAVGPAHLAALRMDHRFKLTCGCFSAKYEDSIKTADMYGLPHEYVYTNIEEMLSVEKENIDIAIILTPQNLHLEHIRLCFKHNIHIFCEKSMVSSAQEAQSIVDDIAKSNIFFAVTYNYTGYPMIRYMRHIIHDNILGDIQYIVADMPQETFQKCNLTTKNVNTPQAWRCVDNNIPTVSLDLGIHLIQMIEFLSSKKFSSVTASSATYGKIKDIIDSVTVIGKLDGGVTCQMKYGKHFLGHRNGMYFEIYGSEGTLKWVQERPDEIIYIDAFGQKNILDRGTYAVQNFEKKKYHRFKAGHPSGFIEALANYYIDLADAFYSFKQNDTKHDMVFGPETACNNLQILEAITQSSRENKWIDLS